MIRLFVLLAFLFSFPGRAETIHLVNKELNLEITTKKITHIEDAIMENAFDNFSISQEATRDLAGPRVLIINSPGGMIITGGQIVNAIEAEKATGVKYICVADKNAHSMAFNILSHCDVRLATEGTTAVVHKIAVGEVSDPFTRITANYLKELVKQMEAADEPYILYNAEKMHLSRFLYEKFADAETRWTAEDLIKLEYLHGIVKLDLSDDKPL